MLFGTVLVFQTSALRSGSGPTWVSENPTEAFWFPVDFFPLAWRKRDENCVSSSLYTHASYQLQIQASAWDAPPAGKGSPRPSRPVTSLNRAQTLGHTPFSTPAISQSFESCSCRLCRSTLLTVHACLQQRASTHRAAADTWARGGGATAARPGWSAVACRSMLWMCMLAAAARQHLPRGSIHAVHYTAAQV